MTEPDSDGAAATPGPDADVPDSPAGLEGGAGDVAVILAPVPRARFVTALCAFHRVGASVLETAAGPMAVLDDGTPEATADAARALSAFLKGLDFLVVENRGGTVRVTSWKGGAAVRELPAGLALADAPGVVTSIVTGAQTIEQLAATHPDKVHRADMGRFAAYRELLRETRALRRAQGS